MKRHFILPGLGIALVAALAGCGGSAGQHDAGGHGGSSTSQQATSNPGTGAASNDADAEFASAMIPHHRQAVEMSRLLLAKDGIDPAVTELAVRIQEAQGPEIETMSSWLDAWGKAGQNAGHGPGHGSGGGMSGEASGGMMTADQLDGLAAAEGDQASRMFLASMIEHHRGAVSMARQEVDAGAHPEATALAASILQAQESEIQEMEALLAGL